MANNRLNIVAEYSEAKHQVNATTLANDTSAKGKTASVGAILFF